MIGKKSKVLLIALIFMILFNFSYPVVYASGDGMIEPTLQQQAAQTGGTSTGKTNTTLGTIVDHGLRFTN